MVARGDDRSHARGGSRQGPLQDQMAARPDRRVCSDASAFQMLADHTGAGAVDAGAGALRKGAAAGEDAPVVEHVRDVQDRALAARGNAQHQVVILDAFQPPPQAAQPAQQRGPHGEGVVHIVLGEKALAIEVRLEPGL